jgi:biopolymer transport protein ExbD
MAQPLRDGDQGHDSEMADINVTPFIDVVLVLLIIFMIAAPLSTVDVAVDLPVASASPAPRPENPVFVTLRPDLTLVLGGTAVARGSLGAGLDRATGGERDRRIHLRADAAVAYGDVMAVMNLLRQAGYSRIALVGLEDPGVPEGGPGP